MPSFINTAMNLRPIDATNDLFRVSDLYPIDLVKSIMTTPWLDMPYSKEEKQETWLRRKIDVSQTHWYNDFENYSEKLWIELSKKLEIPLHKYQGTAWWLDEPGFTCGIHTDGELPGALQTYWIGDRDLGTSFYYYRDLSTLRYKFPFEPNTGYLMLNNIDDNGYRHLQWHAMPEYVSNHFFRLTSYSLVKIHKSS